MNLELNADEMYLAHLALGRMRMEIDVDGPNKVSTMSMGQKQACRFTMPFVDKLMTKLSDKVQGAIRGP